MLPARFLFRSFAAAACGAFALLGAASAQSPLHGLNVKVGVSGILPEESAKISTIGGGANISNEYVPSLQLEYFFTDNISAELLCCVAEHTVKAVGTSLGTVDLGKVTHFPPTLTAKYHFTGMGPVVPYVGAGVNYTTFFDKKLPAGGPTTHISYGDSFGGALQVGADYKLDDHWSLNLDLRKIWISTDVKIDAGATRINANVDIDPWVVSTGVGYRF